jgi:hypothetical protein
MIEETNVYQSQGSGQSQSNAAVGLAGLCDSGGVIVADYYGRRVVVQGSLEYLARIDGGAIDGPSEQLLISNQPMASVEEQAAKNLMRQVGQACLEESSRVAWGFE